MIYTCYEMVRDCRANLPEGWRHLIANYVPLIRALVAHYAPAQAGDAAVLDRVLVGIRRPESSLFQSLEPAPERWFLAELRQTVLAELEMPAPEMEIDLGTVAAALEPLTVTEKQAAWCVTMRYTPAETGPMLRMAAGTVEKIRQRAAELIRGKVDTWNGTLLADNGAALGRAAAAAVGKDCPPVGAFLDILDGRTTWRGREDMERHVSGCWHCVDHFCRMVEVVEVLRGLQPLSDAEAEPFRQLLGIPAARQPVWKRWLSGA
jgi:hypothetical protein